MPNYIKRCHLGTRILEVFLVSTTAIVLCVFAFEFITDTLNISANPVFWLTAAVIALLIEFVLFWIGIILVYVSSLQLVSGLREKGF